MTGSTAKITLLMSGLIFGLSGCTTPAPQQQRGFPMPGAAAVPAMPGRTSSRLPGSGTHSPLPGYTRADAAASAAASPGQRVANFSAGNHTNARADTQPVSQVGYFSDDGRGQRAGASCDCQSCLTGPSSAQSTQGAQRTPIHTAGDCCNGHQPVRPHGYAAQPPAAWNAYGIDPQEFLCDGGDHHPEAVVLRDGSVGGLQPEDTVVHYTTEAGDIEIQESNRVCLYAPRFSSVRKITGALAGGRSISLAQVDRPLGANRIDTQLPGLVMTDSTELGHAEVARPVDAMRERIRGVPVDGILQLEQTGNVLEAMAALSLAELNQLREDQKALYEKLALAAVTWELDESLEVVIEDLKTPTLTRDQELQGLTIYEFPDAGRLQISKLADRVDAQPGEIVSFAIRVENVGDSPVDQVVLVDNLVTRLEYVEGSQTCSGGAEFQAIDNEGQSVKLQWELTDKLRVGESVTIRFQCKVR